MIFILGSGRSGTTWLGKLFDSHPDVVYRHEPDSVNLNVSIPFLPPKAQASRHLREVETYLQQLQQARYVKSAGHRPFFAKSYRSEAKRWGLVISVITLKVAERLCRSRECSARLCVPRSFDVPSATGIKFVIKSVSSLGRAYLFSRAVPTAKIIHVIRHPCAVVASRLRGVSQGLLDDRTYLDSLMHTEEAHNYPIKRADLEGSSLEKKIAYQWMIVNDKVIAEMSGDPRYRVVAYEDLCRDPSKVTRSLFAFAEIEWSSQTASFIRRLEKRRSSRYFSIMRSPLAAVDRWRQELSPEQIAAVLSVYAHSRVKQLGLGW